MPCSLCCVLSEFARLRHIIMVPFCRCLKTGSSISRWRGHQDVIGDQSQSYWNFWPHPNKCSMYGLIYLHLGSFGGKWWIYHTSSGTLWGNKVLLKEKASGRTCRLTSKKPWPGRVPSCRNTAMKQLHRNIVESVVGVRSFCGSNLLFFYLSGNGFKN